VSTRFERNSGVRSDDAERAGSATSRDRQGHAALRSLAEEVADVADARRELMLRVHRFRLCREDLEDCYSQATFELLASAKRGRAFASLYRSGIRPIGEIVSENPLAQDYVNWGLAGPGRWVTIYATAAPVAHVFAVIAGLRIDTSHNGTDVGPSRFEDGPRWRILGHIPTWAHWSIRHPPGL
jgi:hypothetical protein